MKSKSPRRPPDGSFGVQQVQDSVNSGMSHACSLRDCMASSPPLA